MFVIPVNGQRASLFKIKSRGAKFLCAIGNEIRRARRAPGIENANSRDRFFACRRCAESFARADSFARFRVGVR
jgi:hypothetical protein